uniref:phosphoglycerate kinase n=1 Tax=Manihot esculenta TaxID=3983 RepID=A0A2C9V9Q3_MANES
MGQPLNPIEETVLSEKLRLYAPPMLIPKLLPPKFCWYSRKTTKFKKYPSVRSSSKDCLQAAYLSKRSPEYKADYCNEGESEALPYVQTLREIPKEELAAKVVMVRFDSAILLKEEMNQSSQSVSNAIFTIKYICEAGGKVILVSNWRKKFNSKLLDTESAAEEVANCLNFAEVLSSGVDIFVNDSFSLSHKILASTVAVARFCSAHVVGFHSEESLDQLRKAADANRKPYIAIVGGGNLYDKAAALHFLASKCDGLVFIGMMSFQILHALGYSVPSSLIEPKAHKAAEDIIHFAHDRNIPILYPKDFWCVNDHRPNQMEVLPAHGIMHENNMDWSIEIQIIKYMCRWSI